MRPMIWLILPFVAACNTVPVQTVKVAIPVKCTFEPIQLPMEYFEGARVEDSLYDKMKWLLAERLERIAYERTLEAALYACTK